MDTLFLRAHTDDGTLAYLLPAGSLPLTQSVEMVIREAESEEKDFVIFGIDEERYRILSLDMAGRLVFSPDRDGADYIYLVSDLAELPGKKYRKKRNHCSRFEREHPGYTFERITEDNITKVMAFEEEWYLMYAPEGDRDLERERDGIKDLLDNFVRLGLIGGMITEKGKVLAFSLADPIGNDTVDVVVEKAMHDRDSAYAVINRDMAAICFGRFTYADREDDMGKENLRTAKLRYHPCEIKKKYTASLRR